MTDKLHEIYKDYHFRPNPLGITWTQIAELTPDTSFDASTEEMLMHKAFKEVSSSLFKAYGYEGDKNE